MGAPAGSILPQVYFDGLSQLWGVTAYVAATIVAAGVAFAAWTGRNDSASILRLVTKVFLIGLATVFLRQWLIRLGDVVNAFGAVFGIDPTNVDEKFIRYISGTSPSNQNVSAWDVIWHTGSIGTAIAYALLWLFGWFAYGIQFIVKLVGDILLSAGWALSPLFLSFFLLRPMAGVALKYLLGLVVLVCWPFGWVLAGVVTDALLERAATVGLTSVVIPGADPVGPVLTVLLIGLWMLLSSVLAPYVLHHVLMSGSNPAAAFAKAVGGVVEGTLIGGVGAITAAATGGATVPVAVAAGLAGAAGGAAESATRGGRFPQMTATMAGGAGGFYRGAFMREQATAMRGMADAARQRAAASEKMASAYAAESQSRVSSFPHQPHHPNPNQAAIDIDSYAT